MHTPVAAALISNSPLVLAGLRAGLQQRGDFEIVCACDGPACAARPEFAQARVAIVDVATDAELGPIAALADRGPALLLLWPDRDGPVGHWLAAGHSVLARNAPIETVAVAAQAAAAGLVASTPELASEALRRPQSALRHAPDGELRAPNGAASPPGDAAAEVLTPREREVLLKMSLGLGNREIAQALRISAHTAKFHVAQIIAKLDASSRAHAVAKAVRAGLVEI
jgi:DNA-binding NarL/FixJ family response regulator